MKNRTAAEINLDNLLFNFRSIKEKVGSAAVIPVLKCNAYGHGAVMVAKTLLGEGVALFAVSKFEEAAQLRDSGINTPILIFSRLFPDRLADAVTAGFRITLFCNEDIAWLEKARLTSPAFVHVHVDTGLGGVGVRLDNEPDFFHNLFQSSCCSFEGLYSQFSTMDAGDRTYAALQWKRFRNVIALLAQRNKTPKMIHMAKSSAIFHYPESIFSAARAGIALYGYHSSAAFPNSVKLKPVMTLKTSVEGISEVPAGCPVGYVGKWVSKKNTRIASLPVGFADGIDPALANKGRVIVNGKFYPMVGSIAMDRTMIAVGHDPITTGDEVIVWGNAGEKEIPLTELSDATGTGLYILMSRISERLERSYV